MKLTKSQLQQIIKEELGEWADDSIARFQSQQGGDPDDMRNKLHTLVNELKDNDLSVVFKQLMPFLEKHGLESDDEEDYNPEYYNRYGGHPGDDEYDDDE